MTPDQLTLLLDLLSRKDALIEQLIQHLFVELGRAHAVKLLKEIDGK